MASPKKASLFERIFLPSLIEVRKRQQSQETEMSKITETLLGINDQLNKATKEIVEKISELETRDYMTAEDLSILEHIRLGAQTLDDIVPDEVAEEAKEEEQKENEPTEETPEEASDETPEEEASDEATEETPEETPEEN